MNLKHRNSRSLGERRDCVDRTCWRPPACRTTQRAFRPPSADEPRHPLADLTRTVFAGGKAGTKMDARTLIDRAPREKRALPARARTGAQQSSASARVPPAARGGQPVGVRHHDGGSLSVHEAVYAARRGHGRRPRRFCRGDVRQRARKMRKQPAPPRRPRRLRAGRGGARGASRAARRHGGRARALARALGRRSRGHSGAWGGFGARGGRGV